MSRPILVGYDARTLDRAPAHFGVAVARFTGAPLIVTSVCASTPLPAAYSHEELVPHATEALDRLRSELDVKGIHAEFREVHSTSAPRGLVRRLSARALDCLSSARRVEERSAACCPARLRTA